MAFLGKLFGGGGKSAEKAPSASEAIQKLYEVSEILEKKQAHLEKKVEDELKIIKDNGTKNKRVSLAALRRKKRLEQDLAKIDGTLTTIEFQKEALENANTNAEVLKVMGVAAKAMKQAHGNMDRDEVEDLMDDIREQQQVADEISQAISNPIGFGQDVDEDELLKELEDMEQEELDKQLLETVSPTPAAKLPEVPTGTLSPTPAPRSKNKKEEDEDELAELAQWAN